MGSLKKTARIAGVFYLTYIMASIVADLFGHFAFGDASTTINAIIAHESLFRLGVFISLFANVLFLLAAWALYALLKPVSKNGALLFLIINVAGFSIMVYSHLNLISSTLLLSGTDYLKTIQPDQLQAQATLFVNLYKNGSTIAQVPYGVWLLPLGYLVYKSGFLPKILGALLVADFVAQLVFVFQRVILPSSVTISYPCLVVSFIAELGLTLWLLIKGAKEQESALAERQG